MSRPYMPRPALLHPGVDAAESRDRLLSDGVNLTLFGDVGRDGERFAALCSDSRRRIGELRFAARREHDLGALLGGHFGRGEADAARRSGDDDDLIFEMASVSVS